METEERKIVAERALPMVDLTDLNADSDVTAIDQLCRRAQTKFGSVGAICIWPRLVGHARKQLEGSGIPIATVVNFPGGEESVDEVIKETSMSIADGADEIDLVMPYRVLIDGDVQTAETMIRAVREETSGKALLKVIIESGELGAPAFIKKASELAISAGADFIKTSTGKVPINATPQTAEIMIQAIADSGKGVGFKPAGGIKTTEDCSVYLAIADRIMGPKWASPKTFRFGASSVLDDILAAFDGGTAKADDGY